MDATVLQLIANAQKESKGISVINSVDELEAFYRAHASRYSEWRAIASVEDWLPVSPQFLQDFRKLLSQNKVSTRVIFKEAGLKYEETKLSFREIKTIPDTYSFRSSIDILDDTILIMNPHQTLLALVIESPILVDVFRDMFDLLWKSLPE